MSEAIQTEPVRLSILTGEQALANWQTLAPLFAQGARYSLGRISPSKLKESVRDDLGMVVIAWRPDDGNVYAAFYCYLEQYETGRKCFNISLAGGADIKEWIHLWPDMKEIARLQGCDQIEATGRPGWGAVLGLKPKAHLFVEDL